MEKLRKTPVSDTPISHKPFAISRTSMLLSILVLSFLGFLDATYLTILGYTREIPPCTVTHGCETVLTSRFAYVGSIPLAALGVGFFIIMMILSLQLLMKKTELFSKLLLGFASAAFLSGIGLVYIQAGILHAFCQYCLLAEALIGLIFVISILFFKQQKAVIPGLRPESTYVNKRS